MKELIEKELAKFNDSKMYDGLDDSQYSKLEKMIFADKENATVSTTLHLLCALRNKIGLENDWQAEQWWNHVSDFASNHIAETIEFVKNECSADEFSTLSEIFDDIAQKTNSKEFIDALKETAKKFPEECTKYNIQGSIDDAESYLS